MYILTLGNLETAPCQPQDNLIAAESNLAVAYVTNKSRRSERIVKEVKITREDCNTKNKTDQEPISSANFNTSVVTSNQPFKSKYDNLNFMTKTL